MLYQISYVTVVLQVITCIMQDDYIPTEYNKNYVNSLHSQRM